MIAAGSMHCRLSMLFLSVSEWSGIYFDRRLEKANVEPTAQCFLRAPRCRRHGIRATFINGSARGRLIWQYSLPADRGIDRPPALANLRTPNTVSGCCARVTWRHAPTPLCHFGSPACTVHTRCFIVEISLGVYCYIAVCSYRDIFSALKIDLLLFDYLFLRSQIFWMAIYDCIPRKFRP